MPINFHSFAKFGGVVESFVAVIVFVGSTLQYLSKTDKKLVMKRVVLKKKQS